MKIDRVVKVSINKGLYATIHQIARWNANPLLILEMFCRDRREEISRRFDGKMDDEAIGNQGRCKGGPLNKNDSLRGSLSVFDKSNQEGRSLPPLSDRWTRRK